jgi:hypothetical protein
MLPLTLTSLYQWAPYNLLQSVLLLLGFPAGTFLSCQLWPRSLPPCGFASTLSRSVSYRILLSSRKAHGSPRYHRETCDRGCPPHCVTPAIYLRGLLSRLVLPYTGWERSTRCRLSNTWKSPPGPCGPTSTRLTGWSRRQRPGQLHPVICNCERARRGALRARLRLYCKLRPLRLRLPRPGHLLGRARGAL